MVLLASCASLSKSESIVSPAELKSHLSGTVIYFRHAATDNRDESPESIDLFDCSTQRNLSVKGRDQAADLGAFFRSAGIAAGEVLTSPFCRCRNTAQIAFGKFQPVDQLATFHWAGAEVRSRRMDWLRQTLSESVPEDEVRILVGHKDFIQALGLDPPGEGEAIVFRPGGEGGFDPIGRIAARPYRYISIE
jgi:phosphohistidine phosphatase SixA